MAMRGSYYLMMTAVSSPFFRGERTPKVVTYIYKFGFLQTRRTVRLTSVYDCDTGSKYTTTSQLFVGQSALNVVEM